MREEPPKTSNFCGMPVHSTVFPSQPHLEFQEASGWLPLRRRRKARSAEECEESPPCGARSPGFPRPAGVEKFPPREHWYSIQPRETHPKKGFHTRAKLRLPGARPARKYVSFSVPNDRGRVQEKSAAAKKLPAEKNAQQGIERILVPDAIETNSTGKSAECCALEFIGKFRWCTLENRTVVQRDRDRLCSSIRERRIPSRCRTKELRVGHLKTKGHAADRQLELLPGTSP